jgi:hypothetical protein
MNAGMKHLWLVALLAACPPPPRPCTAVGPPARALLMTTDAPQTFSLEVTLSRICEFSDGVLTALPVLTSPAGLNVAVEVTRLAHSPTRGTVEFDLAIPALSAGTHSLQLFLEPTLGVFQLPVFVATDRRGDAGFVVNVPETCLRPARTPSGTQFCATTDAGLVTFRDGHRSDLPGVERVMTAGDVVWAIGRSELRRYVDRPDSGLALTATATLLPGGRDGGSAAELSALVGTGRYDFDADAGALSSRNTGIALGTSWIEGNRVYGVRESSLCDDQRRCLMTSPEDRFLALDVSYVWLASRRPGDPSELTTLKLLRRPLGPDAGALLTLPVPPGFQPARNVLVDLSADAPPMLFSNRDAGPAHMLLLTQGPEGTSFDILPPGVVGASPHFLFLTGTTSRELRVIPLPLTP